MKIQRTYRLFCTANIESVDFYWNINLYLYWSTITLILAEDSDIDESKKSINDEDDANENDDEGENDDRDPLLPASTKSLTALA